MSKIALDISPSEFNRRVTLNSYSYSQGATGGITPVLMESVVVWAKVENKRGNQQTEQGGQGWTVQTRITIRYQAKFNSNWVVDYDGQRYTINNITIDSEGIRKFMTLACSSKENIQNWS